MPSDRLLGSLLRTLIASKPAGNFLELGTGTGLSLSWIIDGMDVESKITSVENNPDYLEVPKSFYKSNKQVNLICEDATDWVKQYKGFGFDLVFADTWVGKYTHLEEVLTLVKPGGFYIVDDMNKQENWPEGHAEKAANLEKILRTREDFQFTRLDWSSGIILMTKRF